MDRFRRFLASDFFYSFRRAPVALVSFSVATVLILMAVLVVRTGSLINAVLFHMVYNACAALAGDWVAAASGVALGGAWGGSALLVVVGGWLVLASRD